MKKILVSFLLISSIVCCNNFDVNGQQKTKHRYGEKILVFIKY